MLFKRKVVNVRPQRIAATPVVPVERETTVVERRGWSPEAAAMTAIGGLLLLGLLFYFMWYRPNYDDDVIVNQPSVVERETIVERPGAPQVITPPPAPPVVVPAPQSPPVVVTPPVSAPDVRIVTPPVRVEGDTGGVTEPTRQRENPPTDAPPVVPPNNSGQ